MILIGVLFVHNLVEIIRLYLGFYGNLGEKVRTYYIPFFFMLILFHSSFTQHKTTLSNIRQDISYDIIFEVALVIFADLSPIRVLDNNSHSSIASDTVLVVEFGYLSPSNGKNRVFFTHNFHGRSGLLH